MSETRYYVRVRGQVVGPFDLEELARRKHRGQLSRFHEISTDRITWVSASSLPELYGMVAPRPIATAEPPSQQATVVQSEPTVAGPAEWYYLKDDGAQFGPITSDELTRLAGRGEVGPETLVWNASMTGWVSLETVPGMVARPAGKRRGDAAGNSDLLGKLSLIFGLAWLGGLGSIAGIVLGIVALTRPSGKGYGLAIAGMIAGGLTLLLWLLFIIYLFLR